MNGNWRRRAGLALLLSLTLTGCGAHTSQQAQIDAAARIGAARAGIDLERQPDECRQPHELLTLRLGEEALAIVKRYENYITFVVNPRIVRCWDFNERQRRAAAGAQG